MDDTRFSLHSGQSDPDAIGIVMEDLRSSKTYYITGDTLYHRDIFSDLPAHIDVMFLPINSVGNNINMADAARICERIAPEKAVPLHCGMFDDINMNNWQYSNKTVPTVYETIEL